ncbi:MAG: TIGR03790 family protein, partial [Byssovorax sp.]
MSKRSLVACATLAALAAVAPRALAGGGPMNVLVLYSADDAEATSVAGYYATARSLPPGHLCGLKGLTPAMTTIDVATYQTLIQKPLDDCLTALPQADEIDSLVLVRGLPYSVTLPTYAASLEAVLQVHHTTKTADGSEIAGAGQPGNTQAQVPNPVFFSGATGPMDYAFHNQYEGWYGTTSSIVRAKKQPVAFHRANGKTFSGYDFSKNLFIVSALDGFDYTDAKALVDRAVASDGTFPKAELLCMRAEDDARGARDPECEFATRMLTGAGFNGKFVDPFDSMLAGHTVAAYFTGSSDSVRSAIAGNMFVPGAITDNLTSYGAAISNFSCNADGTQCPAGEAQTSIARFVRAGATGAHGTVNEPLNNTFPNAGILLHYTFGYSMGESYLYNQRFLYWQNIHLGDPLATPYGERPKVVIDGGTGTHPKGKPITVHATHPAGVVRIDLYKAGARVAQVMSDTLSYDATESVGDALDLLAIAVAANAPAMRPGWPEPSQLPTPDVQGWVSATVTLGDVVPDPAGAGGAGGSTASASTSGSGGAGGSSAGGGSGSPGDTKSGCGCHTAGGDAESGLGALGMMVLLTVVRRRRRA